MVGHILFQSKFTSSSTAHRCPINENISATKVRAFKEGPKHEIMISSKKTTVILFNFSNFGEMSRSRDSVVYVATGY
jgi:hypothetical protein